MSNKESQVAEKPISEEEYNELFSDSKKSKALELALDIRKFEIELYWKRATYFWTFIAAALGAFGVIHASTISYKTDLSVVLCCLGVVFSVGWLCVNRGSKHWQENWENHVDMLEDDVYGPIYKVVLKRPEPVGCREFLTHAVNGPSQISVSKVNQIISLYVSVLWVGLLFYSLPKFDFQAPIHLGYTGLIILTALTCLSFFVNLGATHSKGFTHNATIRTTHIESDG
ncbi:hypothetical protein BVJ64_12540 [Vibrio cholerae]|nr:hypothetical protein [Vibrio cholerae]